MEAKPHPRLGSTALDELACKVEDRSAWVGIVGLGYVGLPLSLLFAQSGLRTTGFDVDSGKIDSLREGDSYITHIPSLAVAREIAGNRLHATSDFARLADMDAILICVPTPVDDHREPDLSFVRTTAEAASARLRPGQLVVLESTTYPGTTEEVVLPILEQSALGCPVAAYSLEGGEVVRSELAAEPDFLLAFSPEREDPGNQQFRTAEVPKIVGGVNAPSALAAQKIYQTVFEKVHLVSSSRAAEMTKLVENIYRSVNIALVNELKLLCLRMGLDIWEIIDAAKTKPFGFTPFYPGPGLGGHCIPIDPFYLTWKAREYDLPTRFIELAGEINCAMPGHVAACVADALNRRGRCLQGARVLILGVAYKKDVGDLRESPSLRIIELLRAQGAEVDYHDPYFPRLRKMRRYDFKLAAIELSAQTVASYDAVVIVTDHSSYDYPFIVRHARLIVDTRNATGGLREFREKIVAC